MDPKLAYLLPKKLARQELGEDTDAALQDAVTSLDAPQTTVAGPAQAAPDTGDSPNELGITPNQEKQLAQKAVNEALNPAAAEAAQGGGVLASTKPDWYKGGPRPVQSAGAQMADNAVQGLAGAAQAQAKISADTQYRPTAMKMQDAQRASTAGALSGVLSGLLNKPQTDYDANLNAAAKQAQMYRTLNPVHGKSGAGDLLGTLRYLQGAKRLGDQEGETARKVGEINASRDAGSQQTKDMRAALAPALRPALGDVVDTMTAEQLLKARTALMQRAHEVERGTEVDRAHDIHMNEALTKNEAEQAAKVKAEQRAETKRNEELQTPGIQWEGGHAPDSKTAGDARMLFGDRREMMEGAKRLKQIQSQLEQAGMLAGAGGDISQYIGTDEQKKLLSESKLIQSKMTTAARRLDNMGVPQQFEIAIQDALNPKAGSLQGFFRGQGAWDSIHDFYDQKGLQRLHDMKAHVSGESGFPTTSAIDAPPEEQIQKFDKPVARKYAGGPAAAMPEVPTDAPALPVAPVPAAPSPAAQTHTAQYLIDLGDGSAPEWAPLTQAQLEKLQLKFQKMGKGKVLQGK